MKEYKLKIIVEVSGLWLYDDEPPTNDDLYDLVRPLIWNIDNTHIPGFVITNVKCSTNEPTDQVPL